jgi:hypothetical protein
LNIAQIVSVIKIYVQENKKKLELAGSALSILGVLYVIIFLINIIKKSQINYLPPKFYILIVIFSFVSASFVYINAYSYNLILNNIHKDNIKYLDVINVYINSNIYKYLPSNVMHYVGRNIIAIKYNFDQKKTIISTIVEIIIIIASTVVFGLSLFIYEQKFVYFSICTIVIILLVLNKFNFLKPALIIVLITILNNVIFVLLFNTYNGANHYLDNFSEISLYQTVSWLIGYLTPGAPGGLGVKEFVLIKISGNGLASAIAIVAIIHRVILIAGDLLAVLMLKFGKASLRSELSDTSK